MQGFIRVCDTYLDRFAVSEAKFEGRRADGAPGLDRSSEIDQLSHELAQDLLAEVAPVVAPGPRPRYCTGTRYTHESCCSPR